MRLFLNVLIMLLIKLYAITRIFTLYFSECFNRQNIALVTALSSTTEMHLKTNHSKRHICVI